MIVLAVVAVVAFLLGVLLSPVDEIYKPKRAAQKDDIWALYVEPTDDPSKYRGVYETAHGKTITAEGYGLTNTLDNLSEKIGSP